MRQRRRLWATHHGASPSTDAPPSLAGPAEAEAASLSQEGGRPPAQTQGSYTLTLTHTLLCPPVLLQEGWSITAPSCRKLFICCSASSISRLMAAKKHRVTRKMDSCVSLQPHAPGEYLHTGGKGSVLRKAEPTAFVGKLLLTARDKCQPPAPPRGLKSKTMISGLG